MLRKLRKTAATIKAEDINFDRNLVANPQDNHGFLNRHSLAPCKFMKIYQNHHFQISVFILPRNGAKIPLHDHPNMYGIIKVIYGKINVKTFTRKYNKSPYFYTHD